MNVTKEIEGQTVYPGAEAVTKPARMGWGVLKAMLWGEWFAHSRILLIFLATWLVAVWVLPLFTHPGWVLILGPLYALIAGPLYGGGDVLDGSEEFCCSLPPTRAERYCARLVVGAGTLLIITGMNLIALGLDLPHVLAGLYIKTGLIQPMPLLRPGLLYGLIVALPLTIFSFSFVLAALTHSRMVILLAWFWSSLAALAFLQIGFWYESLVWEKLNGMASCPLLLATAVGALLLGFLRFKRKEIGHPSLPLTLPGLWWIWVLLFVIGLGLALALISSLAGHFPQMMADHVSK